MQITRKSPLTGVTTTLDLPVTQEQLDELALPGPRRRLLQDIFPALAPAEREFIKTGYTDADWQKMFPPEEEDL